MKEQEISFLSCCSNKRERKGRGSELSKLLSMTYGVPSIGICQANNESSSTRHGLRVGIENMGFFQGFKEGVREIDCFGFRKFPWGLPIVSTTLQEVEIFPTLVYFPL